MLNPEANFISKEGTLIFLRENFMSGSYFCVLAASYRAKADKPDEIPLIIQSFIFWLSYRAWVGVRGWSRIHIGGKIRS